MAHPSLKNVTHAVWLSALTKGNGTKGLLDPSGSIRALPGMDHASQLHEQGRTSA